MRVTFGLLILFAAIQTHAAISLDTLKAKLDGKWEWVETSGGYAGNAFTPQSEHYSLALVFSKNAPSLRSDSIGYQVYRNDTLILSGFTTLSSNVVPMKAFGPNNFIRGEIIYTADTLLLETLISDGYSSVFFRPRTSQKIVRGTISDSATGAPIGNVKVVLLQMAGENELKLDSAITGTSGSYSFSIPNQNAYDLHIYTISDRYFYQSRSVGPLGAGDTITNDIKLKRIPTIVSAAPHSKAAHGITVRTAKSRLYLSGITAGAVVDISTLNGRLLSTTIVPAGASEVRMPEWTGAAGCYQVSIRAGGRLIHGMVLSR